MIKKILKSKLVEDLAGKLIHYYIRFVKITSKVNVKYQGSFDYESLVNSNNHIFAFWHQQIAPGIMFFGEVGPRMTALISSHSDGKIVASAARNTGCSIISGSSNKDASSALRAILQTLRSGGNIIITPDGPRGPREKVNSNIMAVAAKTSSFIVPVAFSSSRYIQFKSWDLFRLPLPFSKINVIFQAPISATGEKNIDDNLLSNSLEEGNEILKAGENKEKISFLYEMFLYALSIIALPLQLILLFFRVIRKKEDLDRVLERLAIASDVEKKDLVWLHAASVGESIIAFLLIDIILKINKTQNFLITTGTKASAELVLKRMKSYNDAAQPELITHQFLPIDNIFISKRFLNYWKPGLAIFIESELWPNILHEARKICPVILANGRISAKSLSKWHNLKFIIKNIAKCFSAVLVQSGVDKVRYEALGFDNISFSGNLKYIQKENKIDEILLKKIKDSIGARRVIFAASTHPGEEEIISSIFIKLKKEFNDLLLIIAPRHPDRTAEIMGLLKTKDLNIVTKTSGHEINKNTDIFILDTIGEMAMIYKLKPITFMGGSFTIGGHNILEPAMHGSLIIYGPDMKNFEEISAEFLNKEAAMQAKDAGELEEILRNSLNYTKQEQAKITDKAYKIIESKQKVEEIYSREIERFL